MTAWSANVWSSATFLSTNGRGTVVWNIPVACNRAAADFLVSSPLMETRYERLLPDHEGEVDPSAGPDPSGRTGRFSQAERGYLCRARHEAKPTPRHHAGRPRA
jgi:hypothetical protein